MTILTRRAVLGGTLGLTGLAVTGTSRPAVADAAGPDILRCDTWGAEPARGTITMVGPPKTIVIHHTDSANVSDYSRQASLTIARKIQGWHFDNGWVDSGQHFTVSRGGYVLEGRHRTVEGLQSGKLFPQGAHASGANPTALGIENEGSYMDRVPPSRQWDALVGLCAHLCRTYGLTADALEGHRDVPGNSTDCPGSAFHAKLPQLRTAVAAELGSGGGGTERPWPVLTSGSKGFRVTTAQHLLREADHDVRTSGTYDAATIAATKAFQQAEKLDADGKIGKKTWQALAPTVRAGSRGDAVKGLQVALTERGQKVTVDGIFGSGTTKAVEAFQGSVSLPEDGVVGLDTWSRLLR